MTARWLETLDRTRYEVEAAIASAQNSGWTDHCRARVKDAVATHNSARRYATLANGGSAEGLPPTYDVERILDAGELVARIPVRSPLHA